MSEATVVDGKTGSQWLQLGLPGWYGNPDDPEDRDPDVDYRIARERQLKARKNQHSRTYQLSDQLLIWPNI